MLSLGCFVQGISQSLTATIYIIENSGVIFYCAFGKYPKNSDIIFDIIADACRRAKQTVTDDATLVEHLGYRVKLFMGAYDNIKITTPDDLALAEVLWSRHGR